MSPLLMGLLGVMLVPLFIATWRASLLGLACQGLLLAWVAYRLDPHLRSFETYLSLLDLLVLRGLIAPLLIYRAMRTSSTPGASAVAPPNLLTRTVAFGLVIGAFNLSPVLVAAESEQRDLVSVAVAGVLLAFLVLASQPAPFGQVVGALRLENAIALIELGRAEHSGSVTLVKLGQIAVVAGSVALYAWLLRRLLAGSEPPTSAATGPTL